MLKCFRIERNKQKLFKEKKNNLCIFSSSYGDDIRLRQLGYFYLMFFLFCFYTSKRGLRAFNLNGIFFCSEIIYSK
jgi:hypothetical protein